MKIANVLLALCVLATGQAAIAQHRAPNSTPYAGEQTREIKALSPEEQRAWVEGQGAGQARAAELNGYPGPMHVLELAEPLKLTESQSTATRVLMDQHKAKVRRLGIQLVQAEWELNALFRDKHANEEEIRVRMETVAQLQARIRNSHLQTHLKQTELLTAAQVERYDTLRGYR